MGALATSLRERRAARAAGATVEGNAAAWRNVRRHVWRATIGGSQVVKRRLSSGAADLLGRPLRLVEATEARDSVRRLAARRLLEPALDENYRRATAETYAWPTAKQAG